MTGQAGRAMPSMRGIVSILLGALLSAFALRGFLVPNRFFDGGVTGVSLVLHEIYHINIAYLIVAANLPFVVLAARQINRAFAARMLFAVMAFGLCLLVIPYPVVTPDRLLVAIFGGVFLGVGAGLAERGGAALDGIEVLALYTGRNLAFNTREIILALNVMIFAIAAFMLGMETALYSTLTYFAASRSANFVVEGIEQLTEITIVSSQAEAIKKVIVLELGRGITVYKGERGFLPHDFNSSTPVDIIKTVVTRLEVPRLRKAVYQIDPRAFIVTTNAREALGGILTRRHLH
ncbi:YitT family protein [Sphingomonas humi]